MSEVLEALQRSPRNVVVVGTLAITEPDQWEHFRSALLPKIRKGDLRCTVIAESENALFQHSLRTDTSYATAGIRMTFTELRFRSQLIEREFRGRIAVVFKGIV